MAEEWLPFPEDERYEISSWGRVCGAQGFILKLYETKEGLKWFKLGKHGKSVMVSRAVLETFVGPCPHEGWFAAHKNKVNDDNHVENLEWQPPEQVQRETTIMGCHAKGSARYNSYLDDEKVLEIRRLWRAGGIRQRELAVKFQVSVPTIAKVVNYHSWKHVA